MASNVPAGGKIRPVILAGGTGSRLWPLSTDARPKPLLALAGERSLLEETVGRFTDATKFAPPVIVTSRENARAIQAFIPDGARLVLEPVARNSGPAIGLAASLAGPDELLLVVPSDHHIADVAAFHRAIAQALDAARGGTIVTFGIEPTHAETGFGYIEAQPSEGVRPVVRFVEKPSPERAQQMIEQGGHYWNAGIFLATARTWREELQRYAPDILAAAKVAIDKAQREGPVVLADEAAFARSPAQSIDYAVMEHSDRIAVVPVSMGWSDIGNWAAVFDALDKDADGNVVTGDALVIDSCANLIRSEGPCIAAIGVDDLVIVATADSVLVARLSEAQRVREAAEWFKQKADDGGKAADRE